MTVPRCPICGAQHVNCGGPSGSVPVDQRVSTPMSGGRMVQVQLGPRYVVQMNENQAKQYVKDNPGARILSDEPEAKQIAEPPEDKQVTRKRTKRRKAE